MARLGSFQAQNLERSSGQLYDWNKQSDENRMGMQTDTRGIEGAFTGGVVRAGMNQAGGVAGNYFGGTTAPAQAPAASSTASTPSFSVGMPAGGRNSPYTGGLE